jgi:hypothetical protein
MSLKATDYERNVVTPSSPLCQARNTGSVPLITCSDYRNSSNRTACHSVVKSGVSTLHLATTRLCAERIVPDSGDSSSNQSKLPTSIYDETETSSFKKGVQTLPEQLATSDTDIKSTGSTSDVLHQGDIAKVEPDANDNKSLLVGHIAEASQEIQTLADPVTGNKNKFQWTFKGQSDIIYVKKIGIGGFAEVHMVHMINTMYSNDIDAPQG